MRAAPATSSSPSAAPRADEARWQNSSSAANASSSLLVLEPISASVGCGSEPSPTNASPGTPSGSRLVARMRSRGRADRRSWAMAAAESMTCSQLSSTISTSRPASASTTRSRLLAGSRLPSAIRISRPVAVSTALATSLGPTGASSTRIEFRRVDAASSASRVLPAPPVPMMVTRRLARAGRRSSEFGFSPDRGWSAGRAGRGLRAGSLQRPPSWMARASIGGRGRERTSRSCRDGIHGSPRHRASASDASTAGSGLVSAARDEVGEFECVHV